MSISDSMLFFVGCNSGKA